MIADKVFDFYKLQHFLTSRYYKLHVCTCVKFCDVSCVVHSYFCSRITTILSGSFFFTNTVFFLRLTNELLPRKRFFLYSQDINFVVWILKIEFFEYIVIKLQLRTY